jgi:hypothetical protein
MVLSVKGWLLDQDEATKQAYVEKYSAKRATVTEGGEEDARPRAKGRRDDEDGDDEANEADGGLDDGGLDDGGLDDGGLDDGGLDAIASGEIGSVDIESEEIRPDAAGSDGIES